MAAMIFISPLPQFGHRCMSMSNTRVSNRPQMMRCGWAWTVSTSQSDEPAALVW
jgi:hypothetical protein